MTTPTESELQKLVELRQAATQGECKLGVERTKETNWIGTMRPDGKVDRIYFYNERGPGYRESYVEPQDARADYIVALHNAAPGLIEAVRELQRQLKLATKERDGLGFIHASELRRANKEAERWRIHADNRLHDLNVLIKERDALVEVATNGRDATRAQLEQVERELQAAMEINADILCGRGERK